ncbi:MAG: LuxR C-terminal-related transcriptional regulator, partial [Acidimicrobiia bacterium]|nr:LuxR C-terminal-related transcriptional regulator [Acidimicrobiia bacterium]
HDACLDHADHALDQAHDERHGIAALAHLYRGVVWVIAGDARGAQPELETAARLSERLGDYYAALSARMSLGAAAVQLGDLDLAVHRFESVKNLADTVATTSYDFPLAGAADVGLGLIAFEQLDLDRAATLFRRGIHELRSTSAVDYAVLGFCRWADTESIRGNHPEAEQILVEANDFTAHLGGTAPSALVQALAACEARTRWRSGDLERSWALHRRASSTPSPGRWELVHPPFELQLLSIRLHLAAGDVDAARTESEHLSTLAGSDVGPLIETAVVGAEIALASGDEAGAEESLCDALASAGPAGWARPFVDGGPAVADLVASRGALGRELSTRIVQLAGADAGRSRSSEQPLVVPLTPREREVLAEVAAGFTNAEIAERLYISVGTTKRHIANIFMKLDATHRTGAVARARQLGILD